MNTYPKIILNTNPLIREKSKGVLFPLTEEIHETIKMMKKYVDDSCDPVLCADNNLIPSVGISAIQVGKPLKIIYINAERENENTKEIEKVNICLINPKITKKNKTMIAVRGGEGCLSVPECHDDKIVLRSSEVSVRAYDYDLKDYYNYTFNGIFAIIIQHEIDHLFGILFTDKLSDEKNVTLI